MSGWSPVLLGPVLIFQASAHWIILAEETRCIERFGSACRADMGRVRRCIQDPWESLPARNMI